MKRIIFEISHDDMEVEKEMTQELTNCGMTIVAKNQGRLHTLTEREIRKAEKAEDIQVLDFIHDRASDKEFDEENDYVNSLFNFFQKKRGQKG